MAHSETSETQEETVLLEKRQLLSEKPLVSNNDVLDNYGFGRYQWLLALCCSFARAAAFSHIILGTSVVSNQNIYWKLSLIEDRMVYTVLAVFCLIGSAVGGKLSDIYGRKLILLPGTILSSVAMIIGAITPHYYLFLVCSVLAGVAIGANLAVSSCLYGEFIPNTCRSYAVIVLNSTTCFINLIICLATYFFCYEAGWRWHYGLIAVPNSLAFLCIYFLVDESPRFFGAIGNTEGQLYVLARIKSQNKPSKSCSLYEENLINTVTTVRGTWKGMIYRFFGATLASASIGFAINAVITMITFSVPIMIAGDYCGLPGIFRLLDKGPEWGGSDQFEYILLAFTYFCLIGGSLIAHLALTTRISRTMSFYALFAMLLVTLLPQMECFSSGVFITGILATMAVIGAIMHVLTLSIVEMFPTYIRGSAFGIVYAASFLGTLYGPYVDIIIGVGSLKSTYLVFFVLTGTILVLVNRGIIDTKEFKIIETKDDLNYQHDEYQIRSVHGS